LNEKVTGSRLGPLTNIDAVGVRPGAAELRGREGI